MSIISFKVGDHLLLKKQHPCGNKTMQVISLGSDIKIKCIKCGHEMIVPRIKLEKNIKKVMSLEQTDIT